MSDTRPGDARGARVGLRLLVAAGRRAREGPGGGRPRLRRTRRIPLPHPRYIRPVPHVKLWRNRHMTGLATGGCPEPLLCVPRVGGVPFRRATGDRLDALEVPEVPACERDAVSGTETSRCDADATFGRRPDATRLPAGSGAVSRPMGRVGVRCASISCRRYAPSCLLRRIEGGTVRVRPSRGRYRPGAVVRTAPPIARSAAPVGAGPCPRGDRPIEARPGEHPVAEGPLSRQRDSAPKHLECGRNRGESGLRGHGGASPHRCRTRERPPRLATGRPFGSAPDRI
jgi:hypothetical protein